ncbi:TRAP transporter small permease [Neisseria perflava]|uniref:TRAP transporter small permease n=1 Tax=Neisseria perflava TaxID=33053 RepID=UPI00209CB299|nr:TRAP transporter small permease [Neisseria perflava]MCP1660577.1 TRAP-type C4-dicarboxylate transport system permease small subunit [Neisseria perflava]MCP1772727.1 TRAP-type C4-dicarboxylate transport system permease small subunit [Neisseria perflava]
MSLSVLNRLDKGVAAGEQWLLVLLCAALTLVMIAQVVLRYFFNAPLFWAEEICAQFLAFITAFGLSYLTYTKHHICIDFVLNSLGKKGHTAVALVLDILLLAVMAAVCAYAWQWVLRPEVQTEISGTTGLPRWYSFIALPLALSFLCFHQIVLIANRCAGTLSEPLHHDMSGV